MSVEIELTRMPYGMSDKKTLTPTVNLVKNLLERLSYSGTWTMICQRRAKKRVEETFRALRLEQNGIRIRCKPGGNETCYEYVLMPPHETTQSNDQLLQQLQRVHPRRLEIPDVPSMTVSQIAETLKKPEEKKEKLDPIGKCGLIEDGHVCNVATSFRIKLPEGGYAYACDKHRLGKQFLEIIKAVETDAKIHLEKLEKEESRLIEKEKEAKRIEEARLAKQKLEEEKEAERQKHLQEAIQKRVEEKKKEEQKEPTIFFRSDWLDKEIKPKSLEKSVEKTPIVPEKKQFSLKIEPGTVGSLSEDPKVLDNALIAAVIVFDKEGHANKDQVTTRITQELGIAALIKNGDVSNLAAAMRSIMMGLVREGYLQRYGRKRRSKTITEGYVICPPGRRRINALLSTLPQEYKNLLWSGSVTENIVNIDVDSDEDAEEGISPADVAAIKSDHNYQKVSDNLSIVKPLVDEHTNLVKQVADCDEIIADLTSKIETDDIAIAATDIKINKKLVELREIEKEIQRLTLEKANTQKQQGERRNEVVYWGKEKESYHRRIDEIMTELREKLK